ncbi:MAG: 2-oxoglutarate dehydrogenase complex dihydrolipoyllysine-residue succinyltransferase [Desulfobacterales bacterium]|nr:2-oxoglutarate dehydrogenase complex dihydrolipoyllysine-residue succinyltransferase [Desulfobacterales bacterium]
MKIEIKIPSVGESVKEAVLVEWFKKNGDSVQKDEPLFLIETDKVTLEVAAEADGVLEIKVSEGKTVAIGAVVGTIDTQAAAAKGKKAAAAEKAKPIDKAPETEPDEPAPKPAVKQETPAPEKKAAKQPEPPPEESAAKQPESPEPPPAPVEDRAEAAPALPPSVRRLVAEKNIDVARISGTGPGARITKGDVLLYLERAESGGAAKTVDATPSQKAATPETKPAPAASGGAEEAVSRKPMSPIRRRIAARLLEAKQGTAMLTTFNDIDMTRVMQVRALLKEKFKEKYGVPLGFMSFFIKATLEALKDFPEINAAIDGDDIVYHHYHHIGIAIGSDRGLVVPVIRHADRLGFAELEGAIVEFVKKINEKRLELADLEGGTFTISNGGIYGSLLSTPILNMPQSGILGMHRIEDRPVARDGKVENRPMMYVALSYDHRIVDGREAVIFLKRIKECVENPELIMMEI